MLGRKGATYILLLDLGLQVETVRKKKEIELKSGQTSSSGVKSLTMLNSLRISSGVLPLIMLATVLQPTSLWRGNKYEEKRKIVAGNSQQGFDVKVVGREDDLEEHFLVYGNELLVPFGDVGRAFAGLILGLLRVRSREWLATVVLAVLEDLSRALITFRAVVVWQLPS